MKIVLFLTVLFIQFQSTQYLSLLLLVAYLFRTLVKNVMTVRKVRKEALVMLFFWLAMILMMIRPEFIVNTEAKVEVLWLGLGAIAFLIIALNGNIKRISAIKSIIYAGTLGASIQLVLHMAGVFPPLLATPPYAGTRWVGGFDGPNEIGAFYLMMTALSLGLYLEKESTFFWSFLPVSIFLPIIYFTFSRGTLLGFVFLLGVFIVYSLFKSRHKILLFLFYGIVGLLFYFKYLDALILRFNTVRDNAGERGYLFYETSRLLKDSPAIGHGLGAFEILSPVYNTTPHSDYLLFLVSGGVIGTAILIYFYYKFTFTAFKMKFYPEFLAILVFLTQAMTFNNIVRGRLSILFWAIVIVIYLAQWHKGKQYNTELIPQ